MSDRTRAKLAYRLLRAAKWLLKHEPLEDPDWDACHFCRAKGCQTGEAEHAPDCPQMTGVYPVTLRDIFPDGPACCETCDAVLWPGESYSVVPLEIIGGVELGAVACTGCAVLHRMNGTTPGN